MQGNLLDKASGKEKEKEKVDVNKQALTDVTIATWNNKVIKHTHSLIDLFRWSCYDYLRNFSSM